MATRLLNGATAAGLVVDAGSAAADIVKEKSSSGTQSDAYYNGADLVGYEALGIDPKVGKSSLRYLPPPARARAETMRCFVTHVHVQLCEKNETVAASA